METAISQSVMATLLSSSLQKELQDTLEGSLQSFELPTLKGIEKQLEGGRLDKAAVKFWSLLPDRLGEVIANALKQEKEKGDVEEETEGEEDEEENEENVEEEDEREDEELEDEEEGEKEEEDEEESEKEEEEEEESEKEDEEEHYKPEPVGSEDGSMEEVEEAVEEHDEENTIVARVEEEEGNTSPPPEIQGDEITDKYEGIMHRAPSSKPDIVQGSPSRSAAPGPGSRIGEGGLERSETATQRWGEPEGNPNKCKASPQVMKAIKVETTKFTNESLRGFNLDPQSKKFKEVFKAASVKAGQIKQKYGLTESETKGVVKLAFYDFVILCDDSTSMNHPKENRIKALKDTLIRVANIATMLQEDGISIRFLNDKKDSDGVWGDNLKTTRSIEDRISRVKFNGKTPLGTVLEKKIVKPLIMDKVKAGTFEKPLITVVITDGTPTSEAPGKSLENTIRSCKTSECLKNYGDAAVVFIVSRVGKSLKAEEYLHELGKKEDLKKWVYCSKDRLEEGENDVFKRARETSETLGENPEYTKKLLQMFLAALDHN